MDIAMRMLALQTLLDETSACVAATDETGRLTMFSPALQRLFKQPLGSYAEDEMAEQFGLYDADGVRLLTPEEVPIARARAGEHVHEVEITAKVSGRPLLHLVCNGAPLLDDEGVVRGAVLVVKDVTAERAAVQAQADLRRHDMASINHEFRTALTALLGNVEMIPHLDEDVPDDLRRPLGSIRASALRLRHLVDSVTALVDLDEVARLERSPCDLGALVRSSASELAVFAESRGVTVTCTIGAHAETALDPARMHQAVLALIASAVTYAPPRTEVGLRVDADATTVRLEVRDAGRGIPSRERSRMLRAFHQGDESGPPDTGRGLGLVVAFAVAQAHGGQLEITDHEPQGLVAVMTLPRHG